MTSIPCPRRLRLLAATALLATTALLAGTPPAAAQPPPQGESLACGQEIIRTDANGTFFIRFQCLPSYGVLNWGFTFAPQWRAAAISPVTESGMRYWQNGRSTSDNAAHREPVGYLFHGTIPRVFVGDDIEYQDFFTFRANFGADTGTARIAVAGSVILKP